MAVNRCTWARPHAVCSGLRTRPMAFTGPCRSLRTQGDDRHRHRRRLRHRRRDRHQVSAMSCSVLAVDVDADALARLAQQNANAGPRLPCATFDVTDELSPPKIFALCRERLGEPAFLVNNAGLGSAKEALETTDATWHRYIDINLGSAFRMSRQAVIERKGEGSVVNIASVWGMAADYGRRSFASTPSRRDTSQRRRRPSA